MFKKTLGLILILSCLVSLSGCSGYMRKKFVREKKGEQKIMPVFTPEVYETSFTAKQRYANHYAFWKSSIDEAIELLNQENRNNKKLTTHASYALQELKEMQNLFVDEQKPQIEPYIKELGSLVELIKDSSYVSNHGNTLVKELKHNYREVSRNFSFSKMKDRLKE
ncbi:MAG: hypothetical protein V2A72_00190 [Candidatus Omnitrophota bacterium]